MQNLLISQLLEEVNDELNQAKTFVEQKICPLSLEQLNWKAKPNQWSIGQCVEHLDIAIGLYEDCLLKAMDKQLLVKKDRMFHSGIIGSSLLKIVNPEGESKSVTPKAMRPSGADGNDVQITHQATEKLLEIIEFLIKCTQNSQGKDISRIKVKIPLHPFFKLKLGDSLRTHAWHLLKHCNQMQKVMDHIKFPKNA